MVVGSHLDLEEKAPIRQDGGTMGEKRSIKNEQGNKQENETRTSLDCLMALHWKLISPAAEVVQADSCWSNEDKEIHTYEEVISGLG